MELLNEEETISECKNQNAKLLQFICQKDNLKKLIEYATRLPKVQEDEEISHARGHR